MFDILIKYYNFDNIFLLKFMWRAQNLTKCSPSIWRYVVNVKSTVKISSNFVAFLENINFKLCYGFRIYLFPGQEVILCISMSELFKTALLFRKSDQIIATLNITPSWSPTKANVQCRVAGTNGDMGTKG